MADLDTHSDIAQPKDSKSIHEVPSVDPYKYVVEQAEIRGYKRGLREGSEQSIVDAPTSIITQKTVDEAYNKGFSECQQLYNNVSMRHLFFMAVDKAMATQLLKIFQYKSGYLRLEIFESGTEREE